MKGMLIMYQRINRMPLNNYRNNSSRGFIGPFVLGGITGGLLAPAFYPKPYPVPVYPSYYLPPPYYYQPYKQYNYYRDYQN